MRLHELRLAAVGPFADEQVIDFDRLGAGGLFLFEGPTGVGKSTILDAITFALYGGLASESGDAARMRSDFAAADQRPEVSCEFSVRGARFRVTRSPEYLRPKKRGGGLTREKSAVHLQSWRDGGWVSQSHAKDEVGTLIGELLGLNRAQFRQVVLLPQGEFATFLRADDDARKDVLVKLFGTQFFRQVTEGLQARAQAAGRDLDAAQSMLDARVAAACEAAGSPAEIVEELSELDGERTLERLDTVGTELSTGAAAAHKVLRAATDAEQAARDEHDHVARQSALVVRRAGIHTALATAELQRPAHEERSARLTAARRALPVRPLLHLVESTRVELADREAELAALRAEGPNAGSAPGTGKTSGPDASIERAEVTAVTAEALTQQAQELRSTAAGLAHLVEREQGLATHEAGIVADRAALATLVSEHDDAAELARVLPEQVDHARAALDAARVAVERARGATGLLENARRRAAAAAQVDVLGADLVAARRMARAAKRTMRSAVDGYELLIAARWTDLRAEIASQLVSGDPCGVCGSREHPAPTSGSLGGISEQQVRQAAADRDEAQHVLDEADRLVFQVEAQLASARSEADGRSVEEWTLTCVELEEWVAAGELAQSTLPSLTADLDGLVQAERSSRAECQALAGEVAARTARIDATAEQVDAELAQVRDACDGFPTVAARVSSLTQRAAQCAALGQALGRMERAATAHTQALERALSEAAGAGFADLEQARAAILEPDELAALDKAVALFEELLTTARAQLAEPELVSVADLDPAQAQARVTATEEALRVAIATAQSAREVHSIAAQQEQRFVIRLAEVRSAESVHSARAVAAHEARTLDQYARGLAGTPRMQLVTFVLRYWFEQVVVAANLRLDEMSAGKYQLVRTDSAARRDARVGLGLAVLDRHTGKERSPATLSGGETFYTSLALALGLTDVVVAQAGGAQLDTLFIDEGFGTLDPDTLDDVMSVIDDLRGNGRVIGVVSHVPDLKERICERLTIRRVRRDGPSEVEVMA